MVLEFRKDPLKNIRILVANERALRPNVKRGSVKCPFCKGSEFITPPTKFALPSRKGWKTRVFDNAFSLLKPKLLESWKRSKKNFKDKGIAPAFGEHEVIVETDEDALLFQDFSEGHLKLVFESYSNRFGEISRKKAIEYVLLFKNHGRAGGASIEHEHSQILGLPFIPEQIAFEADSLRRKDLLERLLSSEKENILLEGDYFSTICPSFSRFPYECWIIPKEKRANITEFSNSESREYMGMLRNLLSKVYRVAKDYNITYHSAPKGYNTRMHIEIYPRPNVWAGLELATGIIANTKTEKEALQVLK